jgi:methylmalonyl-CoA mutase
MVEKLLIANRPEILRSAGLQGIYRPGSNIVECAADVLRLLGHNMPPVGQME